MTGNDISFVFSSTAVCHFPSLISNLVGSPFFNLPFKGDDF